MQMLNKYEENNLSTYVDNKSEKMVFEYKETPESDPVKDLGAQMCQALKNPYFNLYHWCKGELSDIEALNNALLSKEKILARIQSTEKKKTSQQSDLDTVAAGKKSVTTIMKSQKDTGNMTAKIEAVSIWIFIYLKLYKFIDRN